MKAFPRTAIWLAFWLTALVMTHLPPPRPPVPPPVNDKLLHFAGFAGLGFLTIWRLGPDRGRVAIRWAVAWFAVLVIYGAFDELTQPWFRRDCELLDWLADAGGAALGIGATIWSAGAARGGA